MIQSYDLYMPVHLVFGRGRIAELPKLIAGYGKKVLLTYGGGSVKRIGLYDKVKALLAAEGCTVFELSGIEPNPKIESVRILFHRIDRFHQFSARFAVKQAATG